MQQSIAGGRAGWHRSRLRVGLAFAAVVSGLVLAASTGVSVAAPAMPAAPAGLDAPTGVTAIAGTNTARVTWLPPAMADLSEVSYEVTATPGGQRAVVAGTETGTTVRFLTNGTDYTFTVAAFDFDDVGALSVPSAPVTPLDICTLVGTPGDDVLTGTAGDDAICGLGGDDTLRGGGGGDTFVGGPGTDFVDFGTAGERVHVSLAGAAFNPTAHGLGWANGAGNDVMRPDIESVRGSAYPDVLEGNDSDNVLIGRGGSDLVRGWGGADRIVGGPGADELWGLSGDDRLFGGGGRDVLMPRGDTDVVNGGPGSDTVTYTRAVTVDLTAGTAEGQSSDVLRLVEDVDGSPEGDVLRGSSAVNVLRGGAGDDVLSGRGGDDRLAGQDGADAMDGGGGAADRCAGGAGIDTSTRCESVVGVP